MQDWWFFESYFPWIYILYRSNMEQPTIFKSDPCYPGFAKRPFKSTIWPNQQTNALSSSSPNSRRYFLRRTEVGCTWPSSRYKMTWRGWSLDSTWKSYCLDPRWFVWPHFGQLTVLLFRASVFKWAVKVLVQLESHSQWWIQFQYCSCFHYKMVSALCLAVFILPHIGCMIQIDSEFSWFNFFQLGLAGCAPWGSKWRAALGKSRIPSFWDVEHEMWTVS